VQVLFLTLNFFEDWVFYMFVKLLAFISSKFNVSFPEPGWWHLLLLPWQIFRATVPVTIALAQQSDSVILTASVIIACLAILSSVVQNIPFVDSVIESVESAETLAAPRATGKPLDIIKDKSLEDAGPSNGTQALNFVKDKFHAEFLWNANLYHKDKGVRHRV
jgi:hypothetical protein